MPYNIAFIGAGRLTHSFLPALVEAGHEITALISRKLISTRKLSSKYKIAVSSIHLRDIPDNTDIIIIAVPDTEIRQTALKLSQAKVNLKKKIVIHCSGAAASNELNYFEKTGAKSGSFHIMQTFPSLRRIVLKGCYAAIESEDPKTLTVLKKIAADVNIKPFVISANEKLLYHITGVYASNFLASNLAAAERIYAGISTEKPPVRDLVSQIIKTTLKNVKNSGAAPSISGPAARGDLKTIKAHVRVLKKKNKKEVQSYIIQSLAILSSLETISPHLSENQKEVRKFLEDELSSLFR